MEEEKDIIIVTDEEANERLDKILANRFKDLHSRAYFQELIDNQLVLLGGEPVKKRAKPKIGDEIEIHFSLTPEIDLTPENIPLNILYEDPYLLIVNKAAGMVVHPAPGNWSGTFVNALLHHCRGLQISDEQNLRPGIVHRLDKDTSGLLVAAKTSLVQTRLSAMFASREIYKEYAAICFGNPGNIEINAPIKRHPVLRQQMAIADAGEGRHALTRCSTVATKGKLSAVKLVIATGRTHQIRVHMKHLGTPIIGDSIYGNAQANKLYNAGRQMLHASILRFTHPITGKLIECRAPIPEDMNRIIPDFEALCGW